MRKKISGQREQVPKEARKIGKTEADYRGYIRYRMERQDRWVEAVALMCWR